MPPLIPNDAMTPIFRATIEATEEAVYNSLLMATTTSGREGRIVPAFSIDEVLRICREYNVLQSQE